MNLYFVPTLVPRTTTRQQWYEAWHQVRCLQGDLARLNKQREVMLLNKDLPEKTRQHLIDEMIYPPLVLGPFMEDAL